MTKGYDKFFKSAKSARSKEPKSAKQAGPTDAEVALKNALAKKQRTRKNQRKQMKSPWITLGFIAIGLVVAAWGVFEPDSLLGQMKKVKIGVFSIAGAQNKANNSTSSAASPAKAASASSSAEVESSSLNDKLVTDELSHFSKLRERKRELDLRERELNELEAELHKQREEIEARIAQLNKMRREISSVLQDRVEVDQAKVGKLVDVYSNMKPSQAADVIGKINEDLAVEVLGRMKKQNAADILNLLEPAKARSLSEKFTGYQRR